MTEDKKLARNVNLMISSELLKQMFDELVRAGFTEDQAIKYMAIYVANYRPIGREDGKNKT